MYMSFRVCSDFYRSVEVRDESIIEGDANCVRELIARTLVAPDRSLDVSIRANPLSIAIVVT